MRLHWLALFAVMGAIALPGCRGSSPAQIPTAMATVTPAGVYQRMSVAMTRQDAVFHSVIVSTSNEGAQTYVRRSELWIEATGGRARSEIDISFSSGAARHATWIIDGGAWYQAQEGGPTNKRSATVCHDAPDAAVSLLLGCRGSIEQSRTVVDSPLTFDGRRALALVTTGSARGAGDVQAFVDHLYIDADTGLPVALASDGTIDGGAAEQAHTYARYNNGFTPKAALAADFFEPSSIGYVAPKAVALPPPAEAGVAILSPGETFASTDGLPALALRGAKLTPPDALALLGYGLYLEYGPAGDEFAAPEIVLREWRSDQWDETGAQSISAWTRGNCVTKTEIAITNGSGVVFAGHRTVASAVAGTETSAVACPGGEPDRFVAEVRIGGSVVVIEAGEASAFDSVSGLSAIGRSLLPTIGGDAP